MTEMTLDPGRGFVALPLDVLDLDLSPGAFRALVEFCRMADRDGWCWPTLAQLGERLGRSRAAISGYIAELRQGELIETQQQRTANGFNYRLRFRVTFWAEWRSRFRRPEPVVSEPECRVKPVERPKEGKNHNHQNQSPGASAARSDPFLSKLVKSWQTHVGASPYPAFANPPDERLRSETQEYLARPAISADMKQALQSFFAKRRIEVLSTELSVLVDCAVDADPDAVMAVLGDAWRPHWRRPPSPALFARIVDQAKRLSPDPAMRKLLQSYCRRDRLWQDSLPRGHISATKSDKQGAYARQYPRI